MTIKGSEAKEHQSPLLLRSLPELGNADVIAARIDGQIFDLSEPLHQDCVIEAVCRDTSEGLEIIRHSTAHLLAHAVKELYPNAQVTIGPVIDNGFYYDFCDLPIGEGDLPVIEDKMREIGARNLDVTHLIVDRSQAIERFKSQGELFKAEIIESIDEKEEIKIYSQGEFSDLCRGPHVPNTSALSAFKLTKVAGAYWRGDSSQPMLTRIYGTAWNTQEELDRHLWQLEEAAKRDHRNLGKQLDLFYFLPEAPGMVFWNESGWTLYRLVESHIRKRLEEAGYQEVQAPQVLSRNLWERSGHWDKFQDYIFTTRAEEREYAIKPMNCPGHVMIFNQGLRSYRDLPLKISEFGHVHRNEPSGTLHGLMRARRFTQDDAHVFCSASQMHQAISELIELTYSIYADFGFTKDRVEVALSTRPEKRIGDDALWDQAEEALRNALVDAKLDYTVNEGEGAFYGPKHEFLLTDCLGRKWQCGTIQVDFFMPGRLDAHYVDADNKKQVPIMIHRAILGSLERFIGILLEEYAGKLPMWLAPVQLCVLSVSQRQIDYAAEVASKLKKEGFRARVDYRNETLGFKIRSNTSLKVPYLLVVGDREVEANQISVRSRDGDIEGKMSLDHLCKQLASKTGSNDTV